MLQNLGFEGITNMLQGQTQEAEHEVEATSVEYFYMKIYLLNTTEKNENLCVGQERT